MASSKGKRREYIHQVTEFNLWYYYCWLCIMHWMFHKILCFFGFGWDWTMRHACLQKADYLADESECFTCCQIRFLRNYWLSQTNREGQQSKAKFFRFFLKCKAFCSIWEKHCMHLRKIVAQKSKGLCGFNSLQIYSYKIFPWQPVF